MDLELLELITFVSKNKIKNIEILGANNANNSMVQRFYNKLTEQAFTTEEEAANYFFNTDENNRNYKELKRRLKKRLLNTVLFIDVNQEGFTTLQKAYYSSQKDLATASVLYYRAMYNSAIPLLLKLLKQAIKYKFVDIIVQAASMLTAYYGVAQQNLKKLDYYSSLLEKANKALLLEYDALKYVVRLQIGYTKQANNPKAIHEMAKGFYEKLAPFKDDFTSFRFHLYFRVIESSIYTSNWEIEKWYASSQEAISFFKKEIPYFTTAIQHFLKKKIECCLLLGKYDEGIASVKELSSIKGKTINSIINSKRYYIQLLLCIQKYEEAFNEYRSISQKKEFKSVPGYFSEHWKVIEAYLNYLILVQKVNPQKKKKFSIGKFLNEVPEYSKEKRAGNIPILIIQTLFFIQRKQYGLTDRRLETLNKYRVRYLEQGTNIRSKLFIKMLQQIPKGHYNKSVVIPKTTVLLEQLKEITGAHSKQLSHTEIIPYEHLWEMVLESLNS